MTGDSSEPVGIGGPRGTVEFPLQHVRGFSVEQGPGNGGSSLAPYGPKSAVVVSRPHAAEVSELVEVACPTCGRMVQVRVHSEEGLDEARAKRLWKGTASLAAAAMAMCGMINLPGDDEPGALMLGGMCLLMTVFIATALYGIASVLRTANKGVTVEEERQGRVREAGALPPELQFHRYGGAFSDGSV